MAPDPPYLLVQHQGEYDGISLYRKLIKAWTNSFYFFIFLFFVLNIFMYIIFNQDIDARNIVVHNVILVYETIGGSLFH